MSSRRESIVAALVAALATPPTGITKPTGLAVHRYPLTPIEEDNLPALAVYWTDCSPVAKDFLHQPDLDRLLEYDLTVRVEARVMGDPVDQALDPLCQYARQVAFFDPSLSGKAWGCREDGIKVDGIMKGDHTFGGAAVDFVFRFLEEPFTVTEPNLGGNLVRASFPTLPTHETLEVPTP